MAWFTLIPTTLSKSSRANPDTVPCLAKFGVMRNDGRIVCYAYLYEVGRWWLVTPKNEPLFPTKKGSLTWNYDLKRDERLEDVLQKYWGEIR